MRNIETTNVRIPPGYNNVIVILLAGDTISTEHCSCFSSLTRMRTILERKQINRAHQGKGDPENGTNYVPINATNAAKRIEKHSFEINFPECCGINICTKVFWNSQNEKDFHQTWDWSRQKRDEEMELSYSKWKHWRFMSRDAWQEMILPTDIAQFCILNYFHSKSSEIRHSEERVKVTICRLLHSSVFLFISATMKKLPLI